MAAALSRSERVRVRFATAWLGLKLMLTTFGFLDATGASLWPKVWVAKVVVSVIASAIFSRTDILFILTPLCLTQGINRLIYLDLE